MNAHIVEHSKEFDLGGVVPWGRRLWEYRAFFGLDEFPPLSPILDAGGGPYVARVTRDERGVYKRLKRAWRDIT